MALPGLNLRATRRLALLALGLLAGPAGCFSGDDFSLCTQDSECAGDRCVSGRCVAVITADATSPEGDATAGADTGPTTDARPTGPDAELDDDCVGVDFNDTVPLTVYRCPNRDVVIGNLATGDPDGLHERRFELFARSIRIIGTLDAHGAGYRGGGGGGGGGGGSADLTPIGGRRGKVGNAESGDAGATEGTNGSPGGQTPGAGGPGGRGGGVDTPAGSGAGGLSGVAPGAPGGPGADGQHIEPGTERAVWTADLCTRKANARPGAGGGGGGGGAGAAAPGCETGPGGGGGGAGTPGGGALLLHATEAIVINGKLDVSGGDRLTGPSRVQVPGGPCGTDGNCVHACDEAGAPGVGGQGGSSANSGHAGAAGLRTKDDQFASGNGGDGGLGSGGYILLEAPEIVWGEGAALNLSGGSQSTTNPGVLVVVGLESGSNIPDRANAVGYLCDPVEYVPTDP